MAGGYRRTIGWSSFFFNDNTIYHFVCTLATTISAATAAATIDSIITLRNDIRADDTQNDATYYYNNSYEQQKTSNSRTWFGTTNINDSFRSYRKFIQNIIGSLFLERYEGGFLAATVTTTIKTNTTHCSWFQPQQQQRQPAKKQENPTKIQEPSVVVTNATTTTSAVQKQRPSISSFSPYPPFQTIQPNPNLEICYDKRTRNAIFVQHRIILGGGINGSNNNNTASDDDTEISDIDDDDTDDDDYKNSSCNNKNINRPKRRRRYRFREDVSVPEQYRSRNSHYHLSGYDRGHLAPAGDFIMNHTHTTNSYLAEKEIEDTYNLCNISPQNQTMNRTIWSYLEYYIRKVTFQIYEKERQNEEACTITTYITTGPLWIPQRQLSDKLFEYNFMALGRPPSLVHIPTHFYKVVVIVKNNIEILQFGCFVIPNNDEAAKKSIGDYVVSWNDLEIVTGLTFFPNLLSTEWKQTADRITNQTIQQQNDGRQQLVENGNNVLLLTDNASSSSSTNNKLLKPNRWINSSYLSDSRYPVHICANKACLRPILIG